VSDFAEAGNDLLPQNHSQKNSMGPQAAMKTGQYNKETSRKYI
jgi:hypothetical protein